jgi:secondary thiamine-phosphate synthase enzyme
MLRQSLGTLTVTSPRQGLHDITRQVEEWVAAQDIGDGLLTLFCRHTSASLLIQENAAPAAKRDLEAWFSQAAAEDPSLYTHNDEGPDDMPAHIRSALTQSQLAIPVQGGRAALGTWQGIYLFEHRRDPPRREIALHLIGE